MIRSLTTCGRRWRRSALDLVFPPCCSLCSDPLPRTISLPCLCHSCQQQIATPVDRLCDRCGRYRLQFLSDGRCPACRDERHKFAQVVCLGPYAGVLRDSIVRMKHAGQQSLTGALGRELARRLKEIPEIVDVDVFVPTPMHWRRRILRGAGASLMLAEALSMETEIPHSPRLLRCTRQTQKQSTLSPTGRKKNVRGAFCMSNVAKVGGLHIALVDDTLTTGATANEAATVLLKAGASRVTLIAIARADTRA